MELAREQIRILNAEGEEKETTTKRQAAARRRAARQRASRLEAAVREVERSQQEKKHDRKEFVARASGTDPDAQVMRNGEGGTVPSSNVQLLTDVTNGLVVNVDATTDAIDSGFGSTTVPAGITRANQWILPSRSRNVLSLPAITRASSPLHPKHGLHLWTDEQSNLLQILR